ncbi:DUF3291 domain-containing protein [Pseudaestuariivita sp.]|uniref:DUF3291 domain-containing protein n=1 Tax=Pseudaestuariivita sp. TaxID=2211669 RepID=UPI004059D576
MPIAQINVARPRYPLDDPRIAEFVDNLDRINALAERMPGFVWRLKSEDGNATSIQMRDTSLIPNVSVWESTEALEKFVFGTLHVQFYQKRATWFPVLERPHFAMWTVADKHLPDIAEAEAKLDQLALKGPSETVFGWEALTSAPLWKAERCA